MKWIKLTSVDGTKFRINFENIESYFRNSDENFTRVNSIADIECIYKVQETPEEIDEIVGSVWYVH